MFQRLIRGGWPYSQPPNVPFDVNLESEQSEGLEVWLPWGGGTPGAHRHVDRIGGLEFTEGGAPVWVAQGERGWVLDFTRATPDYLKGSPSPVTGYPLTLSIWFQVLSGAGWQGNTLFSVNDDSPADAGEFHKLFIDMQANATTWKLWAQSRDAAGQSRAESANVTGDLVKAHHLCGVFKSATSREIYYDGLSLATNAVNRTPSVAVVYVGAGYAWGGAGAGIDGYLSDGRIYSGAKTAAQVYQMYANPWELSRPRIRRSWAMAPGAPPAAITVPIFAMDGVHSVVFGGQVVR